MRGLRRVVGRVAAVAPPRTSSVTVSVLRRWKADAKKGGKGTPAPAATPAAAAGPARSFNPPADPAELKARQASWARNRALLGGGDDAGELMARLRRGAMGEELRASSAAFQGARAVGATEEEALKAAQEALKTATDGGRLGRADLLDDRPATTETWGLEDEARLGDFEDQLRLQGISPSRVAATRAMDAATIKAGETGPRVVRSGRARAAEEARNATVERARERQRWYEEHRRDEPDEAIKVPRSMWAEAGLPTPPEGMDEGEYVIDERWNTSDAGGSDGDSLPKPMFGDDVRRLPPSIVAELSQPFFNVDSDDKEIKQRQKEMESDDEYDPTLRPHERILDAERRKLKKRFMEPMKIPNRPLHDISIALLDVSQTHNVVRGGMETTNRALVVVGNGVGGVGYGVGRHADASKAVLLAVEAAERDMIFVSTYKGQLYHDIVGKKNNVKVFIQSRGVPHDHPSGDVMLSTVMELAGINHFMGKIVGPKRKNKYTVIQAIFNAFNYHVPYEVDAAKRGLRLVHLGADRYAPRQVYPNTSRSPSYLGASYRDRYNK